MKNKAIERYMTPPEIRSGPHFEWPHMPSYRHLWDPNWIEYYHKCLSTYNETNIIAIRALPQV